MASQATHNRWLGLGEIGADLTLVLVPTALRLLFYWQLRWFDLRRGGICQKFRQHGWFHRLDYTRLFWLEFFLFGRERTFLCLNILPHLRISFSWVPLFQEIVWTKLCCPIFWNLARFYLRNRLRLLFPLYNLFWRDRFPTFCLLRLCWSAFRTSNCGILLVQKGLFLKWHASFLLLFQYWLIHLLVLF